MRPSLPFLWLAAACCGLLLGLRSPSRAEPPATGPATAPSAGAVDPVKVVQKVQQASADLDLSDDQKVKLNDLLTRASQQAAELDEKTKDLPPRQRMQKVFPFLRDFRAQISGVLNPDQMKQLGAKMRGGAAPEAGKPGPFERLRQALAKLDLNDEQKKQVADLVQDTEKRIRDIREKARDGDDVSQQVQALRDDVKEKLAGILMPDQLQQLKTLMQEDGGSPANPPIASKPGTPKPDAARPELPKPRRPVAKAPPPRDKPGDQPTTQTAELGSAAPDIVLQELNGKSVQLSSYKGHVVVLEFGSWSSPQFRDRAPDLEKMKADLGARAFFIVVYTREAHPAGEREIERNKDDGIQLDQPPDFKARKAQADRARLALHITLPMAIDSMDDALATTFDAFPNGSVVIGKDGTITGRQHWTEPAALKRLIEEANK